jgi:hypothetical protein
LFTLFPMTSRLFTPRVGAAAALVVLLAGCGDLEPVSWTRPSTTLVERDDPFAGVAPEAPDEITIRQARYTVQPGDSLSSIATKFGLTIDALMIANNIPDPNLIEEGMVIRIPGPNQTTPPPWLQRRATTPSTLPQATMPTEPSPPQEPSNPDIDPEPPPPPLEE